MAQARSLKEWQNELKGLGNGVEIGITIQGRFIAKSEEDLEDVIRVLQEMNASGYASITEIVHGEKE